MKSLLLCLSIISIFSYGQCDDLFFSEYIEGSSSNKALEIYNPTGEDIDLTNYVLYRNNNGSLTPTDSIFPLGIIAAGDVFIMSNPSANPSIMAETDTTHTITFYNGDDAIWIKKISSGDTLDIIGDIGVDPGSGWPVGAGATNNFTLIRMISVNQGETDWTLCSTQWDTFPIDMTDSLGQHNMIPCPPCETFASILDTACDEYISPSGDYTWTESGTFMDTILNMAGCDSIMTFELTIYTTSGNLITTTACDSYLSPSGDELWTETGVYMDTIPNALGCDSVITVNLTVNYSSSASYSESVCDSLISPSGDYIWTTTGVYNDTIENMVGCDSVLTIDLIVNYSSESSFSTAACKQYISPSGEIWTSGDEYIDTIPNAVGCDSLIYIDLTIYNVDVGVTQTGNELESNNPAVFYQWLDCDDDYAEIPGETDQLFIATEDGNYAVEVSQDGCTDTSLCYTVAGIGMNEISALQDLNVYPNPSQGDFMVDLNKSESGLIIVRNMVGQIILSQSFSNEKNNSN